MSSKNFFWAKMSVALFLSFKNSRKHCEGSHQSARNWRENHVGIQLQESNRPFPSSLVPQFQSESKCETILMKMTLICMRMKLQVELIFIWKVSHLDSFWNRATRELGNGLLQKFKSDTCNWAPTWSRANYVTNRRSGEPVTIENFVIDTIGTLINKTV